MAFSWKTFAFGLLLVALVGASRLAGHYHEQLKVTRASLTEADRKLSQANATITDMQVRQRDVAALDEKYTKELADANAENAALQRKLDAGGRVLVKGKCPVPATTETASASGVGNDATIELSDAAGRNVFGIRSGIISDQTKVKYLQDYIRQQCLK